MTLNEVLHEVVTLPEASKIANKMGYSLDRSNLLRYAQSGRLIARKSQGTWLTTRSALQALMAELARESRGRPRTSEPAWAEVSVSPELTATLAQIDDLRSKIDATEAFTADQHHLRRELLVEAIYHTNHIEGNPLSLPRVREIVEEYWARADDRVQESNDHA
jgi:hypothetical protein